MTQVHSPDKEAQKTFILNKAGDRLIIENEQDGIATSESPFIFQWF